MAVNSHTVSLTDEMKKQLMEVAAHFPGIQLSVISKAVLHVALNGPREELLEAVPKAMETFGTSSKVKKLGQSIDALTDYERSALLQRLKASMKTDGEEGE